MRVLQAGYRPYVCMPAAILSMASMLAFAQGGGTEELVLDCKRQTDDAARLACYDEIANRLSSSAATSKGPGSLPSATPAGSSAAAASPEPASPPESAEEDDTFDELSVTVVDCRRLYDDDYLFTLSNGEYWRQTGGSTLRLRECRFDATISKNFFGYRMTIDGSGETVHVKRVQ